MVRPDARIHSLDYLRGLAALGIMLYHMHLLSFGETDASTMLGRIKIYAVAIFFILSGLTLYKVYIHSFTVPKTANFYVKRVYRIVPLLWLATVLTYFLSPEPITVKRLALNLLVLPGMLKPEILIANGAWSIGNECGFYLLFPLMLLLIRRRGAFIYVLFLAALAPFLFFTYRMIDPAVPLGLQWKYYVSPLSQFLFFVIGMGLGMLRQPSAAWRQWAPWLALAALAGLFVYPASGEPVVLTAGSTRIILSVLTTALCYFIYISDFSYLPSPVQRVLSTLGEISYSVYLLHPIVFLVAEDLLGPAANAFRYEMIAGVVVTTLVLSYFTYEYFEKYFMKLAQKRKSPEKPLTPVK